MRFEHPIFLLAALAPLIWMFFELRRINRKTSVIVKGLSFVAILVAIAEPVLITSENKMAVAVLVDTSASITNDDLARATQLAAGILPTLTLSSSPPSLNCSFPPPSPAAARSRSFPFPMMSLPVSSHKNSIPLSANWTAKKSPSWPKALCPKPSAALPTPLISF